MIQSRRRSNLLITLVAFVALAVASSSPVDAANSKHLRSKHHHNRQVKNEATTAKANNDDDNKARKPIEHRRKAMEAKSKSFRDDVLAPKKNAQPEKKKNVAVQASNRHDKVATSRSKIPRRTKDVVKKNANVQKKTNAKKIIQAETTSNNNDKNHIVNRQRRAVETKATKSDNNNDNDQEDIWDSLVGGDTTAPMVDMNEEEYDEHGGQAVEQKYTTSNLRQRRRLRSVANANAGNTQRKAAHFRDQARAVMMMKDSYETR